jgi:hypothetical protein
VPISVVVVLGVIPSIFAGFHHIRVPLLVSSRDSPLSYSRVLLGQVALRSYIRRGTPTFVKGQGRFRSLDFVSSSSHNVNTSVPSTDGVYVMIGSIRPFTDGSGSLPPLAPSQPSCIHVPPLRHSPGCSVLSSRPGLDPLLIIQGTSDSTVYACSRQFSLKSIKFFRVQYFKCANSWEK